MNMSQIDSYELLPEMEADFEKVSDRNYQFGVLREVFTWFEPGVTNMYEAFHWHYHIMNRTLEYMTRRFMRVNPREDYYIYTRELLMLYTQVSIAVECLMKLALEEEGETVKKHHKLCEFLDNIGGIHNEKCKFIYEKFSGCRKIIELFDTENFFVNCRYMDIKEPQMQMISFLYLEPLIIALDRIYEKYYSWFNITELVYGGMV